MYAIISSSSTGSLCLYKTHHYPLALQTYYLLERHSNTVYRVVGPHNISVSDDQKVISNLSSFPGMSDLIALLRIKENIPAPIYEMDLEPGEWITSS